MTENCATQTMTSAVAGLKEDLRDTFQNTSSKTLAWVPHVCKCINRLGHCMGSDPLTRSVSAQSAGLKYSLGRAMPVWRAS